FSYSLGGKIRLFGMYGRANDETQNVSQIEPTVNMNRQLLDRWKYPGDEKNTTIPAIISRSNSAYRNYSTHWSSGAANNTQLIAYDYWSMYDYANHRVVSSNYLKCQNISLTYQFGEQLIKKAGISRLELTLSGGNLFTACSKKLKGQTPTQSGFATVQLSDRPTYSIGLNVSF
nr:SusC/RagA family TonB-linked outer membrane protein [Odoribacter sp.]